MGAGLGSGSVVAFGDGGERRCQPGVEIDAVHFAGLDQPGDNGPIFGTSVMACEEAVLPVQGHHPFILPMWGNLLRFITGGRRFSADSFGSSASTGASQANSSTSRCCLMYSWSWPHGCSSRRLAPAWTSAHRACRSRPCQISMTFGVGAVFGEDPGKEQTDARPARQALVPQANADAGRP